MTLLHDAYVALLSGLTTRKNEREIWWHNHNGLKVTVEPIDINTGIYVIRNYKKDGGIYWERHYLHDQVHGRCREWYPSGCIWIEHHYQYNQLHGKTTRYHENGLFKTERYYIHGEEATQEQWERYNGK